METDIYGGFKIGPFFKSGFGKIHMSNCVIQDPNGVIIIESLETMEVQGNSLLIKKGDTKVRVLIKPFLEKCINCCEEIINLWNTYR